MKVKINTHGNALPEVHGEWIDLCTAEDVTLDFLEYKIISLGVSIEIPAGYYAHVVPRSSTFGKWGILLANSMGVIENDYCGDGDVWGYTGGRSHDNSAQVERESHGNSENKAGRRNKRSVWSVSTNGFRGAHFAVFPEKLIEPCILAGCPEGGVVLDPFAGSGTTGVVAKRMGRGFVGCEINPSYVAMAAGRIAEVK